ncbi:hypothetical protein BRADI_2g39010v3 [Brachypodium distachyon]|uniref:Uncharacterized protein n=1 Tax=Brachypodium distachyon TaxID=15368 RepID=I1HMX0_BRADI|nr:hypothetical protein BRADI_2g39010v3 [Brachypodium distachyon]
MGRSKPSAVDDDDLASDFLQLKQEVAAQQSELVDLRKDVQRSNTTQDALVGAVDTHQVLAGVGTQMTALTDAFKSLHVQIPGTPGPSSRPPPNTEGISKPPSPLKIPNSEERQKSLELEDLKRQLEMEKEFTRRARYKPFLQHYLLKHKILLFLCTMANPETREIVGGVELNGILAINVSKCL